MSHIEQFIKQNNLEAHEGDQVLSVLASSSSGDKN
tara:strand:- start:116 stop:220 length:105 start_codon:yes stop_codon:yes gene_type:complete